MERAELLKETNNVRRAIHRFNPKLQPDFSAFKAGVPFGRKAACRFALHLLKHTESVFEKNQAEAVSCMGIAIGLIVAHGLVIEEADDKPNLATMKPANTLYA